MQRQLVLIAGSIRTGSISDVVVKTAATFTSANYSTEIYDRMAFLPHFNPDLDGEDLLPEVAHLRSVLDRADGYLFCTPEYAGALPGALKNLLEWAIGGCMYQRPAGWINTARAPADTARAHQSLETVLNYTGALVEPSACADIPVQRDLVGPNQLVSHGVTRALIAANLERLAVAAERAPDRGRY
ncbi:NADPH-dependent FMN reductase [Kribbella sp. NPDC048928]|uniref:NADPH-dependent FMN reductase n=1 Tax=Kribbella sp. NPDC048928 TaxID=3364111 RepID=UPI003716186F